MVKLGPYWKAVMAFLSIVVTNLTAVVANPDTAAVLPQSVSGWLTAAATTIGGTWLVWLKSNEQTVEQIDDGLSKLPLDKLRDVLASYNR